ncbi:hypothetical protein E4U54_005063 [Claviceps lovelessii]|nr:hypothetical protein E4U54_005063 [Claviceps lovelessii]
MSSRKAIEARLGEYGRSWTFHLDAIIFRLPYRIPGGQSMCLMQRTARPFLCTGNLPTCMALKSSHECNRAHFHALAFSSAQELSISHVLSAAGMEHGDMEPSAPSPYPFLSAAAHWSGSEYANVVRDPYSGRQDHKATPVISSLAAPNTPRLSTNQTPAHPRGPGIARVPGRLPEQANWACMYMQ